MYKFSILIFLAAVALTSCEQNDWDIVTDSQASIPVTVSNLYGTFNGVPAVSTSVAGGGSITITLNIPSTSGRTIKEISRVGVSNVTNNYKVVQTTTGLYNTAPVAGSGTSATFTTTLAEFTTKTGVAAPSPAGTSTSFLGRNFYFMITLDNGETIIPMPVRVYVNN
jgi:ABC-type Fe3+-hydroxamate transport system substrate-binding protein